MMPRRATVDAVSLLALAVLCLAMVVIARAIQRQSDAWQWVVHTREVLQRLEQVNAFTRTAESEQRGFMLSSDGAYRDAFADAAADARRTLATIAQLTQDNPAQRTAAQALDELTNARIEWLHHTIANSTPAAPDLDGLAHGRALMQAIVDRVAAMGVEEQRLLARRERDVARANRDLIASVAASGLASAILIAVLRWASQRDAAEIRSGQAKVEAIYRAAPVGLGYVDRELRLLELNDVLAGLTGRTRAAQLGKLPEQLLPPDAALRLRTLYEHVLTRREALSGREVTLPATDAEVGAQHWLVSYQPVHDAAQTIGVVVAALDVTSLKRAQHELLEANRTLERRVAERTAQLSEANEELQAFAHTVAHDLRAPLRNVEGFATALLEDEGARVTDEGKVYLERMRVGVRRMDQLISDLLAYSRVARAEMPLEAVALDSAVKGALQDVAPALERTHALVEVREPLPAVCANRQLLNQVLVNLIGNALKFVAAGVRPSLRIFATPREHGVDLAIEDNGIGIAPQHHERVFGVFERLHGQEAYPGTGIGLAIVRRAVAKMRGAVAIENPANGGTRIVVSLTRRLSEDAHV